MPHKSEALLHFRYMHYFYGFNDLITHFYNVYVFIYLISQGMRSILHTFCILYVICFYCITVLSVCWSRIVVKMIAAECSTIANKVYLILSCLNVNGDMFKVL